MARITPENRVKKAVKELLTDLESYPRVYSNWPVPSGYGESMLDCVGCADGKFFAIETKAPGKHLTPRQSRTVSLMEGAGAAVFVVDGDEGLSRLKVWLDAAREND